MNLNKEDYILPNIDSDIIFKDIRRDKFKSDKILSTNSKKAYYLGVQPGSGKTTVREQILKNNPNIIVLNTDELRDYHPEYSKLMANPETVNYASQLVNHDASIWFQKLKDEAISKGYDVIFDSTLGTSNIKSFEDGINELKEKGYTTELHVLSVPQEISKLGIHLRYESHVDKNGFGRFVNMSSHDLNYKNLPHNVDTLVSKNLFDSVSVHKKKIY